jgi:hypothetical protein
MHRRFRVTKRLLGREARKLDPDDAPAGFMLAVAGRAPGLHIDAPALVLEREIPASGRDVYGEAFLTEDRFMFVGRVRTALFVLQKRG